MKTPTKYTPYLLSISLAVVFIAMMAVTKRQAKVHTTISHEYGTRLNQPGPKVKRIIEEDIKMGNPLFLDEDVNDEVVSSSDRLAVNQTSANDEKQWMNKLTKKESNTIIDGNRYLVLAGSYTDNMRLLSKHAQYINKGFDAEIIRFGNKKSSHICLGRFTEEEQAKTYANTVGTELDIRTFIHDKKSKN